MIFIANCRTTELLLVFGYNIYFFKSFPRLPRWTGHNKWSHGHGSCVREVPRPWNNVPRGATVTAHGRWCATIAEETTRWKWYCGYCVPGKFSTLLPRSFVKVLFRGSSLRLFTYTSSVLTNCNLERSQHDERFDMKETHVRSSAIINSLRKQFVIK